VFEKVNTGTYCIWIADSYLCSRCLFIYYYIAKYIWDTYARFQRRN